MFHGFNSVHINLGRITFGRTVDRLFGPFSTGWLISLKRFFIFVYTYGYRFRLSFLSSSVVLCFGFLLVQGGYVTLPDWPTLCINQRVFALFINCIIIIHSQ